MVTVLTWLTVAYAVVLVLVLAATLVTVAVTLWSTGSTLHRIATALRSVEQQTVPLVEHLPAVNAGLSAGSGRLRSAAGHLAATDAQLAALLGEPVEPGQTARVA